MPPEPTTPARVDALAELAAEAARFAAATHEVSSPRVETIASPAAAGTRAVRARPRSAGARPIRTVGGAANGLPAYVPNAVAPERGNTRPLVPVDGRLHLRAAPAMIDGLDAGVLRLRSDDPVGLRDLERATLVRIGVGLVLADLAAHGADGVVGEAVRAALDPAQRHLDVPMPDPARWLRDRPESG